VTSNTTPFYSAPVKRLLDLVERIGNRLPDPLSLFGILCLVVLVVSWIAAAAGVSAVHPGSGEVIVARNLLAPDGLRRIVTEAVANFVSFPPLGVVLVVMLGVGVAEHSGLFQAGLTALVRAVPPVLLTATVVFAGVNASLAADAGFVVLPPLAALLYAGAGRHPLAGLAAAVAGVGGGFSANLLVTSLDPLLAGLSQAAGRLVDPTIVVAPTANYYFMIASTFLLTVLGTIVNAWIVEPRLGPWKGASAAAASAADEPARSATPVHRRALIAAGLSVVVVVGLLVAFARSVLIPGMVPILFVVFLVPGIVYGVAAGTIRSDRDVARMMGQAMAGMGTYVALAFVAAQFLAWFNWSNLGVILAIRGAAFIRALGLEGVPLVLTFVAIVMLINLLIVSSSAKWAVLAPVFVPMLLLLGVAPGTTQAAYRVGDSCTNIITPLNPYFPMIVVFVRRWQPEAGLGTILALLVPYSLAFIAGWVVLLTIWIVLRIPFGL
jgi:aminobenzoyl-glutamate transport protein